LTIRAIIPGLAKPIPVIDYTVTEDATPLAPGDSSGGVGQISITGRAMLTGPLKNRTAIEDTPFLGRGAIFGKITAVSQPGERISFSADTLLTRLHTNRDAAPHFGVKRATDIFSLRRNLVSNPSIEVNTNGYVGTTGTGGAAAFSRVATGGMFGAAKLRYAWTTTATSAGGVSYLIAGLTAGATYTASIYAQVNRLSVANNIPSQLLGFRLDWYTSASVFISSTVSSGVPATNNVWNLLSATGTAPPSADRVNVQVYNMAGTYFAQWSSGDTLEMDGLLVEQSSELGQYFDGSSIDSSWSGAVGSSPSVESKFVPSVDGYDATAASAFRYYCGLVGIPETSTIVDPMFETIPVAYPAWSGDVWDYLKQMGTAVGGQIGTERGLVCLREPRRHVIPIDKSVQFTQNVDIQNVALNIDIVNQNNQWMSDKLVFAATSAIRIESGAIEETRFTTLHSLVGVNNPVCVAAISPKPYTSGTGQYVVCDADNKTIDPAWWNLSGGKVTVRIDESDPHTIIYTVKAANSDTTHKSPFRLTEYIGDTDVPALFITGDGVFVDPQIVRIPTGASAAITSNVASSLINNIFISDISQAYDRGIISAQVAAGPIVTIRGTIPYDPDGQGQEFGKIVGARIRALDGIYRVIQASYTKSAITITAVMDMTFDDLVDLFAVTFNEFNATYAGLTFDTFNSSFVSDFTFDDFNGSVSAPTFDKFNATFEGLTFDNYAVYPYVKDAPSYDSEPEL
jgi:hypothetical protein